MQPPPLQPAKTDPEAGNALSVTVVPPEKDPEQVVPQLMPPGLLVTLPLPRSIPGDLERESTAAAWRPAAAIGQRRPLSQVQRQSFPRARRRRAAARETRKRKKPVTCGNTRRAVEHPVPLQDLITRYVRASVRCR